MIAIILTLLLKLWLKDYATCSKTLKLRKATLNSNLWVPTLLMVTPYSEIQTLGLIFCKNLSKALAFLSPYPFGGEGLVSNPMTHTITPLRTGPCFSSVKYGVRNTVLKEPFNVWHPRDARLGARLIVATEAERDHNGQWRKTQVFKVRDAEDALHQEGAPNLGHRPLNKSENRQESYTRLRLSAKGTPKPRGPGFWGPLPPSSLMLKGVPAPQTLQG